MKRLLIVGLLCSIGLSAADIEQSWGLKNGRYWQEGIVTDGARGCFLAGLMDGWRLRGDTEDSVRGSVLMALEHPTPIKYSELVAMVNSAYAEPENLSLPVGWVLLGALAVQRGEVTKDGVLLALRKHLASLGSTNHLSSEISPVEIIMDLKKQNQKTP